ncbi:MAG: GNAT family N-acetyltransferase [Bacillaceae bacterium]
MVQSNINMTNRLLRIMRNAEKEATLSKNKVLNPVRLLIACLKETTGALGEISLKCSLKETSLKASVEKLDGTSTQTVTSSDFFNTPVTQEIITVFEVGISYMKRYNQIYMNEGHLLKALLTTNVLNAFLSDEDKQILLTLGTTSRDMITYLGNYQFPKLNQNLIRKVTMNDKENLIHFVENQFSTGWAETIKGAFLVDEPSVYIAFDSKGDIVGFAAYDVYKNRKCYLGPMGVSTSNRIKGLGYSLLHHCLKDMQAIGYEYAIIGGAGPIEFYEKACHAVVIPSV